MANEEHLAKLRESVRSWNDWRNINQITKPDLSKAVLNMRDLNGAFLQEADLRGAELCEADLSFAQLHGADLRGAQLKEADLEFADLNGANLRGADLFAANLSNAKVNDADLSGANLEGVSLVRTLLDNSILDSCHVYGASVWDASLEGASQRNLVITFHGNPTVTVDNLKLAQFIHLLLTNEEVRHIIDTITSKVVLILGRFTKERKQILNALRNELRTRDYTPILFDFEKPASKNLTETISTLAHMARFVIADITDAKSIPQELQRIVPDLPSLPVQPVILDSQYEYAMFKDFLDYPWVLLPYRYTDCESLVSSLEARVIGPAVAKAAEIRDRRRLIESELSRRWNTSESEHNI